MIIQLAAGSLILALMASDARAVAPSALSGLWEIPSDDFPAYQLVFTGTSELEARVLMHSDATNLEGIGSVGTFRLAGNWIDMRLSGDDVGEGWPWSARRVNCHLAIEDHVLSLTQCKGWDWISDSNGPLRGRPIPDSSLRQY